MANVTPGIWRLFWAKTDRGGRLGRGDDWTHPLWAHLLDVACTAEMLFERLPAPVCARLAHQLGVPEEQARALLTLIIGLHDVGKAIPSFQSLHDASREALAAAGLSFQHTDERRHHGHASIPILLDWMASLPNAETIRPLLRALAAFVGFHHGRIDAVRAWESAKALGGSAWRAEQHAVVMAVADAWMQHHGGWPVLSNGTADRPMRYDFLPELLAVAGWTTLSDWVGSMAAFMPEDAASFDDLTVYIPESRRAVCRALDATHLLDGVALHVEDGINGFRACFPEVFETNAEARPRALQEITARIELPSGPALAIVEAPTGEGKSEAAFHLAARLQTRHADGGRGVYVALPTQATSNGLFPRFLRFLEITHEDATAQVQLVHGASGLNTDLERLLRPQDEDEADRARTYAARWFLPTKRGLLAPYGVGTVDQALLGALVARHFFLRLYGLAGKTVIFDEVHAYDTYMASLFERLVHWLHVMDGDVIILSATLPASMRNTLLKAWAAKPLDEEQAAAYPAVTVAEADAVPTVYGPFATVQAERTARSGPTQIDFADSDERAVAKRVADLVRQGATVGIIVNLVVRAQRLFRLLQEAHLDADLELLHARFPFEERQIRECRILGDGTQHGRFGKHRREAFGERPAVLVATQVAEQSLDLDVDVLLSDLAPVDLLLQRAGRMHRHELERPAGFERPRLVVLVPNADREDLPEVAAVGGQWEAGNLEAVYLNLPLFKTYRLLRDRRAWRLPDDYRPLIGGIYGGGTDTPPAALDEDDRRRWWDAVEDRDALQKNQTVHARDARIPSPERLDELVMSREIAGRSAYDEHDDAPARDFRPVTRLGRDTAEVICLVKDGERVTLDGTTPLPEGPNLATHEVKQLLHRGARLSRAGVVRALHAEEPGPWAAGVAGWWTSVARETPALAYHYPLVFEDGRCTVGGTVIGLDDDLGLIYDPDRHFPESR